MTNFVDYSRSLMEAAKGFRTLAKPLPDNDIKQAYLRAGLLHGFSFLEAHINYLSEHLEKNQRFSVNEKGVLLEREVIFEKGAFSLSKKTKFSRITDRMELIFQKSANEPDQMKQIWFPQVKSSIKLRNSLVHPKEPHHLTDEQLDEALNAILLAVDSLYNCVFKKGLPYKKKGIEGGLELCPVEIVKRFHMT